MGDITNLKVGYVGQKITVEYSGDSDPIDELVQDMLDANNFRTSMSQLVEWSTIEGLSHKLCYTKDGEFKMRNLHGWQVIYEYENDIYDPDRAYYFYSIQGLSDTTPTNFCNVYDRENVYYYKQEKAKKGVIGAQTTTPAVFNYVSETPHNFNRVPIIPFKNNSNMTGNCKSSLCLMDAYDYIQSSTVTELRSAAMAYLKVFGDIYTGEDLEGNQIDIPDYVREFGTLLFGQTQDGKRLGDAEFLEKTLDDAVIEHQLDRLRSQIYETSGSIDLKELTQTERAYAVKVSMLRLENDAKTTENYFIQGLKNILDLYIYYLQEYKNISLTKKDFKITIGRVFPQDSLSKAQEMNLLSMNLDLEDALRISGFDDPYELAERAIGIPLDE
jgi:SPP1 family phage portal protein